jgi:autotransporter-associated beta strand protein
VYTMSQTLGGGNDTEALGRLTKTGPGTLVLTGTNSNAGGITVGAGTLQGSAATLAGDISNSAAVVFDQPTDATWARSITGGGTVTKTGAGRLSLTGNNTAGGLTVSEGGLQIGGGSFTLTGGTLTGPVVNDASLIFDVATSCVSNGAITGAGSVTKSGGGMLDVPGSVSCAGGIRVTGGTLRGSAAAFACDIVDDGTVEFNEGSSGTYAGTVSGSGAVTKSGAGTLRLSGSNSYAGGTTVTGGWLEVFGDAELSVPSSPLHLAYGSGGVRFGASFSLHRDREVTLEAGGGWMDTNGFDIDIPRTVSGDGGLAKIGAGRLTLSGGYAATGPVIVTGGVLALPLGVATLGSGVSVNPSGTLEACGSVRRAISGSGTVTATGDLTIGSSTEAGQFNQIGPYGVGGGTLNVGANAVVILSSDAAILGTLTSIGPGGSLTTINGAYLGPAASLDPTKVLTASGRARVGGNFLNNGLVNGPAGTDWLTFADDVTGAGSFTGNVRFSEGWSPGNSAALVSAGNVALDATAELTMELGGTGAGSGYDRVTFTSLAAAGSLNVALINGFTPQGGQTFDLFDGPISGAFATVALPELAGAMAWDGRNLYADGTLKAVQCLPGDANKDLFVRFDDYQALERNFGKTSGATWGDGDFDFDGDVDFSDYQALERNFGHSIPEPASIVVLIIGTVALLARGRK